MYIKIVFYCLLFINYYFFDLPLRPKKNYTRTIEINKIK